MNEEYMSKEHCEIVSHQLMIAQEKLYEKLEAIEKRLFKDNGTVSVQTRLDRHEQILRVLTWCIGTLGGGFLVALGTSVAMVLRKGA